MAKQVRGRVDGGSRDHSDHSYSNSDSYRSNSIDGEGEVFDDEGYYNESFQSNAEEEYYNQSFGEEGDFQDEQFQDEGGSYGSDYSDYDD